MQRQRSLLSSTPSITSLASSSTDTSTLSKNTSSFVSHQSRMWLLSIWLLLTLVVVGSETSAEAGQTLSDAEVVDHYLGSYGYYHHKLEKPLEDDNSASSDPTSGKGSEVTKTHTEAERHEAMKRLQDYFHLPVTGEMNDATKKLMTRARCGREDVKEEDEKEGVEEKSRSKRYAIGKTYDGSDSKWQLSQLTWRITEYSRQIPHSSQKSIISKALKTWAQVVPIAFKEDLGQEEPDINIRFARRQHGPQGDAIFDGNPQNHQNVLAHAWGPGLRPQGFAGDVHFDEDDDWSNQDTLLGVAVHELGHVMGLLHSKDQMAIMFPVYGNLVELGQDDIDGIRALYGSNRVPIISPFRPRVITARPNPRYTIEIDSRYKTHRLTAGPDPRYRTERPDPRYRTVRPDPRYQTVRPDPRYRTVRPDPRYQTVRPDPRYRTERPDPRYWTVQPDPRYQTVRPDPRYRTIRPDPRYQTERPDWRYRTARPDPRSPTQLPDSRYWTLQPDTGAPTTPDMINECTDITIDAVLEDPRTIVAQRFFVLSGDQVHTLTPHGKLANSQSLSAVFPEFPGKPDVAFSIRERQTVYFIKGNQLWAYTNGRLLEGYPKTLQGQMFPETPKFSVTMPTSQGLTRVFLFGEKHWWNFEVDRTTAVRPDPISTFSPDLPNDIMFGTMWADNYLYVTTKDSYVILDINRRQRMYMNPIPGKPEWLRHLCDNGARSSAVVSIISLAILLAVVNEVKTFLLR